MRKPVRDPLDPSTKVVVGVACSAAEDKCRQEFKADTDVERQLRRYGGGVPLAPVAYGVDVGHLGLQDMFEMQNRLQEAFKALPEAVSSKYATWQEVLAAIDRGELQSLQPVEKVSEEAAG